MANVGRLKELRRVAEAAPGHRLHMRAWAERGDCGTAYCLAGFAAIDPWFEEHTAIRDIFRVESDGFVTPILGPWETEAGLADLFDLGEDDAKNLFALNLCHWTDPHAVSKADVLASIDRLLAGDATEPYAAAQRDDDDDDD